jgi:hypothetical protein
LFAPNYLGHTDNYIPADPLVTPAHIVPEWYFLPFYAILRSIPDKLGGVIMLALALIVLLCLPFVVQYRFYRSTFISILHKFNFWSVLVIYVMLGWIGGNPIEYPFYEIGQMLTFLYFFFFLVMFNWSNFMNFHLSVWIWHAPDWNFCTSRTWGLTVSEFLIKQRLDKNAWYFTNTLSIIDDGIWYKNISSSEHLSSKYLDYFNKKNFN